MTVEELTSLIRAFTKERDWEQFHAPRNLVLALAGEVGELAAEVQWKLDEQLAPGVRDAKLDIALREEIADVGIYLMRLADVLNIDLAVAIVDKLESNASKYPVSQTRGSSAKYTDL